MPYLITLPTGRAVPCQNGEQLDLILRYFDRRGYELRSIRIEAVEEKRPMRESEVTEVA